MPWRLRAWPALMPGWAMLEELTLGELSHLFSGLARDADRKAIAQGLQLPAPLLASWLHTLTVVRNGETRKRIVRLGSAAADAKHP